LIDPAVVSLLGGEQEPDGGPVDDPYALPVEQVDQDGDRDRDRDPGGGERDGEHGETDSRHVGR